MQQKGGDSHRRQTIERYQEGYAPDAQQTQNSEERREAVTCIAGIAENGMVYLGGDSASSTPDGESFLPRRPKVFLLGEIVIGVAGSGRVNSLIRHKLSAPPINDADPERYLAVDFVDALKAMLKEDGRKDEELMEDSFLMVGLRGRLFVIDSTFQVLEMACGYDANGSAGEIARGSLHTTNLLGLSPLERLRLALDAARAHNAFVRKPFIFVQTDEMRDA